MEEKRADGEEAAAAAAEGGLKELVLRWFTGTQAPLLQRNGSFPDWFQGFTARREAEELLRDKAVGCFLIRLSDKAIGYILSYKGLDRCRHFVITQDSEGLFAISGDCLTHRSLSELIQHYTLTPIQPFGEYLAYSCSQGECGELYDVVKVSPKEKSGVSVQALRTLWDQKSHQAGDPPKKLNHNQNHNHNHNQTPGAPPGLPPKARSRKLTVTVSADASSLSQEVSQAPKRGLPLGVSLSGSLAETRCEAGGRSASPPLPPSDRNSASSSDLSAAAAAAAAGATYSQLRRAESRSRSLPRLDQHNLQAAAAEDEDEDEEYSNQLGAPLPLGGSLSTAALKRVMCHTYSLHRAPEGSCANPLYHSSQEEEDDSAAAPPPPHGALQGDATYAEVPLSSDDTYEQIPGEAAATVAATATAAAAAAGGGQANTYESLEDMKLNKSKSTWGKNNVKWKKFLPDYMKK